MYGYRLGTKCLFCMPNRINCILLVSVMHPIEPVTLLAVMPTQLAVAMRHQHSHH
jgi:hypothetical protein